MTARVSEEFLDQIDRYAEQLMDGEAGDVATRAIRGAMVSCLLAEVKAHRAAALTSEEVAVLKRIARFFGDAEFVDWNDQAKAVFHKLLAAAGGG